MSFLFSTPLTAASNSYPKLANYFLKTPITQSEIQQLAKWDVVILGMQVQDTNPNIFHQLRNLNPDIKILAYLSAMEFPIQNLSDLESVDGPWHKMGQQIDARWYLKDGRSNVHSIWPGNYSFNLTSYCPQYKGQKFNEYLPHFVKNELMNQGYWDGVFYDNVLDGIKFTNNGQVDIDNNYQVDDGAWVDQAWRQGMLTLLKNTRQVLGSHKIILVNSSSYTKDYINGRLYESWPDAWHGGWAGNMQDYQNLENSIVHYPQIIILNLNTHNTGNSQDYAAVRFGLTSTLLGNGYFAFDFGTQDHSQLWRYDEYDINLGIPASEAHNLLPASPNRGENKNSVHYQAGVWRRDYANGIVLVNSTNQSQTVDLGNGIYEKIRGSQDPQINNGQLVKKVTLPAEDGLILLRKIELKSDGDTTIQGTTFTNGAYTRIFDKRGNAKRSGFYAYQPAFEGGAEIVIDDLDNDGSNETVVAGKSKIQIFNSNGSLMHEFYPYAPTYNRGINLAIGNVQGDEHKEIVTGTRAGGGPHVRVFNYHGKLLNKGWFAYDQRFRGGVQVALGDLNGNGYKEIVTGAGFGGGPHVRIFDATGHLFDPGFFPYDPQFRGGVNVTCADLNNDGKDEIITGAGPTGGPHVRIYDKIGHLVDPGFFAFDPASRNGVRVGAADVDGDGQVEILGMN